MRVNAYYLGLIEKMDDGIWRQAIPDVEELEHYMDLTADHWTRKEIFRLVVTQTITRASFAGI